MPRTIMDHVLGDQALGKVFLIFQDKIRISVVHLMIHFLFPVLVIGCTILLITCKTKPAQPQSKVQHQSEPIIRPWCGYTVFQNLGGVFLTCDFWQTKNSQHISVYQINFT